MAPMPSGPPSNGLATTGFVCGLVGLIICLIPFGIFFGGIVAVIGIVFGFLGRSRAREVGTGRGMATAGSVLGVVGLIVGVLWLVVFGSIFNRVKDNIVINEGDFTVSPQTCRANRFGSLEASGTITNTTNSDKILVQVHVTVRDSRGVAIGANEDFVGGVDAHSTHSYFVTVSLDDPTVSEPHCEVSVG
jgi:hypothetical protein